MLNLQLAVMEAILRQDIRCSFAVLRLRILQAIAGFAGFFLHALRCLEALRLRCMLSLSGGGHPRSIPEYDSLQHAQASNSSFNCASLPSSNVTPLTSSYYDVKGSWCAQEVMQASACGFRGKADAMRYSLAAQ